MKKETLIFILLALFLFALGGLGAYFVIKDQEMGKPFQVSQLQQLPSQESKWRTYRNDEYGFEIDYPVSDGWEPKEGDYPFPICKRLEEEKVCIFYENYHSVEVAWLEKYTLKEIIEDYHLGMVGGGPVPIRKEFETKYGVRGCIANRDIGEPIHAIFLKKEERESEWGKVYPLIVFTYCCPSSRLIFDQKEREALNTFEQMVSTFRFIEGGGDGKKNY